MVVIPAASPTTPYILPTNGILFGTDMQLDPAGNVDVLDYASGTVVQLTSANPVNVGNKINVGGTGSPVQFNFEFNQATTLRGFRVVTQGDVSQELTQSTGGTCVNGKHTNLGAGGPTISNFFPYTCVENFSGTPTYPGLRTSAIQVKGANATILASTAGLPDGFCRSRNHLPAQREVDRNRSTAILRMSRYRGWIRRSTSPTAEAGKVYSTAGLGGSTLTPVSTGTITLSAPTGLALDGAGNLFIADFDNAQLRRSTHNHRSRTVGGEHRRSLAAPDCRGL